jgi:hypothetical protein
MKHLRQATILVAVICIATGNTTQAMDRNQNSLRQAQNSAANTVNQQRPASREIPSPVQYPTGDRQVSGQASQAVDTCAAECGTACGTACVNACAETCTASCTAAGSACAETDRCCLFRLWCWCLCCFGCCGRCGPNLDE